MKLRIRGNTIRIKMTKTEVAALGAQGQAEDRVRFSPTDELRHEVTTTAVGRSIRSGGSPGILMSSSHAC
jgi:Family of unknown function (DUF7009)